MPRTILYGRALWVYPTSEASEIERAFDNISAAGTPEGECAEMLAEAQELVGSVRGLIGDTELEASYDPQLEVFSIPDASGELWGAWQDDPELFRISNAWPGGLAVSEDIKPTVDRIIRLALNIEAGKCAPLIRPGALVAVVAIAAPLAVALGWWIYRRK